MADVKPDRQRTAKDDRLRHSFLILRVTALTGLAIGNQASAENAFSYSLGVDYYDYQNYDIVAANPRLSVGYESGKFLAQADLIYNPPLEYPDPATETVFHLGYRVNDALSAGAFLGSISHNGSKPDRRYGVELAYAGTTPLGQFWWQASYAATEAQGKNFYEVAEISGAADLGRGFGVTASYYGIPATEYFPSLTAIRTGVTYDLGHGVTLDAGLLSYSEDRSASVIYIGATFTPGVRPRFAHHSMLDAFPNY